MRDNKVYTEQSINNLPDLIYSLMLMSMAHEDSAQKGDRVAKGWAAKRHRAETEGHKLTHMCPAWPVLDGNEFKVVPEQAQIVRRVFQLCIDGQGSMSIAKQLNHEHVPTPRGADGWHPQHIRNLLHSRAVLGDFTPGNVVNKKRALLNSIPDYYPAIISREVFYQAQHAIAQRMCKGGRPGGTVNLFATLVRCFHCDGPIVRLIRGNSKKHLFVCNNGRRGRSDCRYKTWDISEFEQKVLKCVREIDLSSVLGSERDVRLKLKQQLRGLVERIEVDLINKQMTVWYIGQRPRMMPISPSVIA